MSDPVAETNEAVHGLSVRPVPALRYRASGTDPYESTYWLMSFMRPKARVLDIGCGTGTITETIRRERDVEIVGLEPNRERAAAARDLGLEVIDGFYSNDLPEKHGRFDYIVFADVLEHLEDPSAMLREVAGALAADGRVLASIPNVAHWTVRLNLLLGRFDYQPTGLMDATHLRWFTIASVRRLFEASGYEVDGVRGSAGGWLPQYRWTPFRLLPGRYRRAAISRLGTVFHGLFACQHVISARLAGPRS